MKLMTTSNRMNKGLRAVALLEALKGALVLSAGFGLLALLHRDAEAMAEELVERFHLNPAHHYPKIFLALADKITDRHLWLMAVGAASYAMMRFIEAFGLWRARAWAEWFGILSGCLYIPLEVYGLLNSFSLAKIIMLVVNLIIVAYLARVRWKAEAESEPA